MPRETTGSLFDEPEDDEPASNPDAPLAERMRPRTLEEFVGQGHLVGEGRLRAASWSRAAGRCRR